MEDGETIGIEVIYALPERQDLLVLEVKSGSTVREGIELSGVLQSHPEVDLDKNKVGIFGKPTKLDTILRQGDRIEIYRPLLNDPKEIRKLRAEQGKALKKGGG